MRVAAFHVKLLRGAFTVVICIAFLARSAG